MCVTGNKAVIFPHIIMNHNPSGTFNFCKSSFWDDPGIWNTLGCNKRDTLPNTQAALTKPYKTGETCTLRIREKHDKWSEGLVKLMT